MELSKAIDAINHDSLIAKLHAYGFDISALKLIRSLATVYIICLLVLLL